MLRMDNSLTPMGKDSALAILQRLRTPSGMASLGTLTLEQIRLLDRLGIEELDWEIAGRIKLCHPILSRVAVEHSRAQYLRTYSSHGGCRDDWTLQDWEQAQAPHRYKLRELVSLASSTQDDRLQA